jgi:hypothetical protein
MARRAVKLLQREATYAQGSVSALHIPSPENVGFAPIAPGFRQSIYLPAAASALSRACLPAGPIGSQEEETG